MRPFLNLGRLPVLFAGLALAPLAGEAQTREREVIITGASNDRPVVVHGAEDVPLTLIFDAPVSRQGPAGGSLVDVRTHPSRSDALVVTPLKALIDRGSVPLSVALADGAVRLTLVLEPEQAEQVVRIVRRPVWVDAGATLNGGDVQAWLGTNARAILKDDSCGQLEESGPQPRVIKQILGGRGQVFGCSLAGLSYLRLRRLHPDCLTASAHLARGAEVLEILVLEEARPCRWGRCQTLVARTPHDLAADFVLELLAVDGTVCERYTGLTLEQSQP
jgi:hypothetical protein